MPLLRRRAAGRRGFGRVGLGDVAGRLPGEHLLERQPHLAARVRGQPRRLLDHADGVLGAGLDAQAAEDAARVVDLEADRELRVRAVGLVEPGLDLDHLGRAHRRAHVARDALRRAVRALRQDVLAAVERRVVEAGLFRVVGGQRALPAGHPAAHVAQEDDAGDDQAANDLGQVRAFPDRHLGLVPVLLALVLRLHDAPLCCSHTSTAVTLRLTSASGSMNFQAKPSTWS